MTERLATYCPYCGTELVRREFEERERRYCPDCNRFIWQNSKPCVGVVVRDTDTALLIERASPPDPGAWAPPGGALEPDEPPAVGAARELHEETGLQVDPSDLILLDTRHSSLNEGYVLSIGYVVSRSKASGTVAAASDASDARFWTRSEIQEMSEQVRDFSRIHHSFEYWNEQDNMLLVE